MKVIGDQTGSVIKVAESYDHPNLNVTLVGTGNTLVIDEGCVVFGTIHLANGASVHIGKDVKTSGGIALLCHEGSSVEIGNNCVFNQNVQFRPSDAHKIFDMETNKRMNPPKPIRIGNNVWVAQDVLFLKGAEIADGCVVAPRSTVTKSFKETNALIDGSPAKVVRSKIRWAQ